MRRLSQLQHAPDRGATIVTVAIMMAALLGAIGLGVDGSALFMKRQHVQNGADAAAFAIAQEYAFSGCVADEVLARTYASYNVPNENASVQAVVVCESGNAVRVVASGEQSPIFMSILGVDPIRVPATASVEWGTPRAGTTIPLTVSECAFGDSAGASTMGQEITVYLPEPSGTTDYTDATCGWHSDYPAGGFGWLDSTGCEAWIEADGTVGSSPGADPPGSGCDFSSLIGERILIPVFDEVTGTGEPATYHISRFAAFEFTGYKLRAGNQRVGTPCALPTPTWAANNPNCIVGIFHEYVSLEDADWVLGPPAGDDSLLIIRMTN